MVAAGAARWRLSGREQGHAVTVLVQAGLSRPFVLCLTPTTRCVCAITNVHRLRMHWAWLAHVVSTAASHSQAKLATKATVEASISDLLAAMALQ